MMNKRHRNIISYQKYFSCRVHSCIRRPSIHPRSPPGLRVIPVCSMFFALASPLMIHPCPIPPPHVFPFHVGSFFEPSLLFTDAIVASGLCHTPSPPSRHHRPTPPPGSVGVQPAPHRDVVGGAPVIDSAPTPGAGGPAQGAGGLGDSAQRPVLRCLRSPRSDGTQDAGPSRDAIRPPVEVVNQEAHEDGELYDEEESYQDGEDWDGFAPPSSSSMSPEPEMVAYWKSSFPAFSTSSSYRPLSSAFGRTKKWSSEAAPDFAPPKQEPFAFSLFNDFKTSSKSVYDNAQHLMTSSGAAGHAIAYAAVRLDAMRNHLVPPDASPEEREEAAPWVQCCSAIASALQDASRILAANYAHGLSETRKGALKSASHHLMPILRECPPAGGYYFGNPKEAVLSSAQFLSAEATLAQASRPSATRPPRRFFQRPAAPRGAAASRSRPAAAESATASSTSSSSSSSAPSKRGKGYGRSSRGGKGGQRKN